MPEEIEIVRCMTQQDVDNLKEERILRDLLDTIKTNQLLELKQRVKELEDNEEHKVTQII